MVLTMSLQQSAELLGTQPAHFEQYLLDNPLQGALNIHNEWRISLFTLAEMLNTSPRELLAVLEDESLGVLMDDVADDDRLSGDDSLAAYQQYLSEIDE